MLWEAVDLGCDSTWDGDGVCDDIADASVGAHECEAVSPRSDKAMAAAAIRPCPFEFSEEWLADTGTTDDLCPRTDEDKVDNIPVKTLKPRIFETAKGLMKVSKSLLLANSINGMDVRPELMGKNCPHAVSVSRQVLDCGRSYLWLNGYLPIVFHAVTGFATPQELRGGLPYFTPGMTQLQGNQERVLELAGLEIDTLKLLLRRRRRAMPNVAKATSGECDGEGEEQDADEAQAAPTDDRVPAAPIQGQDRDKTTVEVSSVAHMASHSPAIQRDGCEDCMVGSKREAPYIAGGSDREVPEEFGSLCTMDYMYATTPTKT